MVASLSFEALGRPKTMWQIAEVMAVQWVEMMMGYVCKRSRGDRLPRWSFNWAHEKVADLENQYAQPTDGQDDQKSGQEIKGQGHLD
jgi:hypothetical protein